MGGYRDLEKIIEGVLNHYGTSLYSKVTLSFVFRFMTVKGFFIFLILGIKQGSIQ